MTSTEQQNEETLIQAEALLRQGRLSAAAELAQPVFHYFHIAGTPATPRAVRFFGIITAFGEGDKECLAVLDYPLNEDATLQPLVTP